MLQRLPLKETSYQNRSFFRRKYDNVAVKRGGPKKHQQQRVYKTRIQAPSESTKPHSGVTPGALWGDSGLLCREDTRWPWAGMTPASIVEQLSVAREQALLGEYSTALVYYDGVVAQINR